MVLPSCVSGHPFSSSRHWDFIVNRAREIACCPDYLGMSLKATTSIFSNQNLKELEFIHASQFRQVNMLRNKVHVSSREK